MAMRAENAAVAKGLIELPAGYNIFWKGQYEYLQQAKRRFLVIILLTLLTELGVYPAIFYCWRVKTVART